MGRALGLVPGLSFALLLGLGDPEIITLLSRTSVSHCAGWAVGVYGHQGLWRFGSGSCAMDNWCTNTSHACANESCPFPQSQCVSSMCFLLLILVLKGATVWQHQLKRNNPSTVWPALSHCVSAAVPFMPTERVDPTAGLWSHLFAKSPSPCDAFCGEKS